MKDKLKGAWRSVTIWFNTVALFLLPLIDGLQAALPVMKTYAEGSLFKGFAVAVVVINVFLRFKTNTDLKDK